MERRRAPDATSAGYDSGSTVYTGSRSEPATRESYHHGQLPAALRAAAAELLAEQGLSGFTLRETARRAGVSHGAPGYHFRGTRGLLTAVAVEGFERLSTAFEAAIDRHGDPAQRLKPLGRAYLRTALQSPGHFKIMYRADLVDVEDASLISAKAGAERHIADASAALSAGDVFCDGEGDTAVLAVSAALYGLVALAAQVPGSTAPALEDQLTERMDFLTALLGRGS